MPLSPPAKPGTRSDLSGVLPAQRMAFSEVGLLFVWSFDRWPELSPGCIMVWGYGFGARLVSPDDLAGETQFYHTDGVRPVVLFPSKLESKGGVVEIQNFEAGSN